MDRRSLLLAVLLITLLVAALAFVGGRAPTTTSAPEPGRAERGLGEVEGSGTLPGMPGDVAQVEAEVSAVRHQVDALAPPGEPLGPRFTLRVVHAGSELPVERFATLLVPMRNRRALRLNEERGMTTGSHPGGRVELPALDGPSLLFVLAEGAASGSFELPGQVEGTERTVQLAAEAVVQGRVLNGDVAQAGVRVELSYKRTGHYPRRALKLKTDDAGRFRFASLVRGELVLSIRGLGWATLERELELEAGQVLDLGVVPIYREATLSGKVLAWPGVDVEGVRIELGGGGRRVSSITDAIGRFGFDDLKPGSYELEVGNKRGLVQDMPFQWVEVAEGADVKLDLDLTAWRAYTVTVQVQSPNGPLDWVTLGHLDPGSVPRRTPTLAITNELGMAELPMNLTEPKGFSVWSRWGWLLGQHQPVAHPELEPLVVITVAAGDIAVQLDDEWTAPRRARLQIEFAERHGERLWKKQVWVGPGQSLREAFLEDGGAEVRSLPPGDYSLVGRVCLERLPDPSKPKERFSPTNASDPYEEQPTLILEGQACVLDGQTATCTLE